MNAFTFSAAFITFFSVVGPPKVLLSFAGLAQVHPARQLRTIALISSAAAVLVGLLAGITAPWLLDLFHISTPALQLAGGLIFFLYAVGPSSASTSAPTAPTRTPPTCSAGCASCSCRTS